MRQKRHADIPGCRTRRVRRTQRPHSTMQRMTEPSNALTEAIAALVAAATPAAPPPTAPETVLTIEEVAERLKISKGLVYRAIGDGTLKSIRIGKRRLVPASEVQRLIESAA
jgi:excisionase family DNA binding protein